MMGSSSSRKIIGESLAIQTMVRLIEKVAPSKTNILITGESGTGKELVARSIHDSSPLHGKPFVAINCGAIPETLIESELFGHKKGSFTGAVADKAGLFESAGGGTLFLDEIGELPLSMQVKLLRAIQERIIRRVGDNQDIRIDVRIIAATNRDLEREVKNGKFREDLFYRLNVIQIKAPPLRERGRDIEILARYFLKKFSQQQKKDLIDFTDEALVKISQYDWPGNVRQLENVIERAVTLEGNPQITVDCLPVEIRNVQVSKSQSTPEWSQSVPATKTVGADSALSTSFTPGNLPQLNTAETTLNLDDIISEVERYYMLRAMEICKGKKKAAANLLGITFRSFRYRLQKLGMGNDSPDE